MSVRGVGAWTHIFRSVGCRVLLPCLAGVVTCCRCVRKTHHCRCRAEVRAGGHCDPVVVGVGLLTESCMPANHTRGVRFEAGASLLKEEHLLRMSRMATLAPQSKTSRVLKWGCSYLKNCRGSMCCCRKNCRGLPPIILSCQAKSGETAAPRC